MMTLIRMGPVGICPAYEVEEVHENVRASLKRPHPRIHHLPEFSKSKGDAPIALVGGGSTVNDQVDELRQFKTVMSVGSAHDWVVQQGVKARYSIIVDAHSTVTASYLRRPDPETTYLVATHCPESVFKALDGFPIAMWHCLSEGEKPFLAEVDPGYQGLGGGCTSGLRAIGMAAVLGYTNLHLFGFDSCLPESRQSHAYPLIDEEEETKGLHEDKLYTIRLGVLDGGPGEKEFTCLGYHVAQGQNFEELIGHHHKLFRCTFHGEGLLSHINDLVLGYFADEEKRAA
jgi:Protein of unknown function DUF115